MKEIGILFVFYMLLLSPRQYLISILILIYSNVLIYTIQQLPTVRLLCSTSWFLSFLSFL